MQDLRKHIIFFSVIAMMISLFVSRIGLSVSLALFVAACFFHQNIRQHRRIFFSSPLLWGMTLLFLLPLLSVLWSEDKQAWLRIMRIKLPLLLLPLAIASPFSFSKKQWRLLCFILIGLVTAGTIWSMFHYLGNMPAVHEEYLRAGAMVTALGNDHVRFSWLIATTFLLGSWLAWSYKDQKKIFWILFLVLAWLVIFLHILASRTGVISFYAVVLAMVGWFVFKKAKPLHGLGLTVGLIALPLAAYFLLPTFRNKIKFFNYDLGYFREAHYLPGGNDASRVISLKAGWDLMSDHAVQGVGFGDITAETQKWYDNHYPEVLPVDRILPSSEWLIYGAGCGLVGFLVFTLVLLTPFFISVKNRYRWWLLSSVVVFGFLFDIGLEVQFGVFIYSFIVLFAWKFFHEETGI